MRTVLHEDRAIDDPRHSRKFLDGIISVTPDAATRTVLVRYDSEKLAIKNIEFMIAGTGYQANELPPSESARSKLPEGCK